MWRVEPLAPPHCIQYLSLLIRLNANNIHTISMTSVRQHQLSTDRNTNDDDGDDDEDDRATRSMIRSGSTMIPMPTSCGKTIIRDYEMPSGTCSSSSSSSSSMEKEGDCHRRYMLYYPTSMCSGDGDGRNPEATTTEAVAAATTLPLVFSVHCLGCSLQTLEHWSELAELYQFVWVNPEGLQHSFNAGGGEESCCGYALEHGVNDLGFFQGIIQQLTTEHPQWISQDWVYGMGWSNGGYMVSAAASLFRAIAPISGYQINHRTVDELTNHRPTAIFLHHAEDDRFVQPTGCCTDPTLPQCCCFISDHSDQCTSVQAQMEQWAIHNGCAGDTHTSSSSSSSSSVSEPIISYQVPDHVTCYTYSNSSGGCQANTTYCMYPHKGHFNQPSFAAAFSAEMGRPVADFFARHMCETANLEDGTNDRVLAIWDAQSRRCICSSQSPNNGPYCIADVVENKDVSSNTISPSITTNRSNHNDNKPYSIVDEDNTTFKVGANDPILQMGNVVERGEMVTVGCLVAVGLGLYLWHRRQQRRHGNGTSTTRTTTDNFQWVRPNNRKRETMVEMRQL